MRPWGRVARWLRPSIGKQASTVGPVIEWRVGSSERPLAILQVSPATQSNGRFVNYGDQVMYDALRRHMGRNGFDVLRVPRMEVDLQQLRDQQASVFIDCAGFVYSAAHFGTMRSAEAARTTGVNASCCRRSGSLIVTAPQTFGPWANLPVDTLKDNVRDLLLTVDIAYVRDRISAAHVKDLGGIADVRIAPDVAFLFTSDRQTGLQRLAAEGLSVGDGAAPIVGIVPNRQVYQRSPTHHDDLVSVIAFFKKQGAQVVIIPHERGRGGPDEKDDPYLSRLFARECGVATIARAASQREPTEAEEREYFENVEAVIAASDFLVSCRFHGAVRGLAEYVPTVVFSWAHKYPTLYEAVGLPPGDHILAAYRDEASTERNRVNSLLERAWHERERTGTHLRKIVPTVKQQVENCLDDIAAAARLRVQRSPDAKPIQKPPV